MIYLDPKKFNIVEETLTFDEFVEKYPTIDYIKIGTMDSVNRPLSSILKFIISRNGIHQLSAYDKTDEEPSSLIFDAIVSFLPPKSREEQFKIKKERYIAGSDMYQKIITNKLPCINPKTFEEFDLSSPEYREYCEKMKQTLLDLENEMIDLILGRSG